MNPRDFHRSLEEPLFVHAVAVAFEAAQADEKIARHMRRLELRVGRAELNRRVEAELVRRCQPWVGRLFTEADRRALSRDVLLGLIAVAADVPDTGEAS